MSRVNPPKQVVLPPEVQSNPQLKKAFDDAYLILFQLWKRTGGGDDAIDGSQTLGYELDDLSPFLSAFLPSKDDVVVASVDYTTIINQIIICTAALTVYLNDEPKDRERVKVLITNGDVTISGNGKLINKKTDQTVIFNSLSTTGTLDIIYILETDEWFIV